MKLFEDTGTVCSIQGYHESLFKKLTAHDEFAIPDILDKPSIHLKEVQQYLLQTTGTDLCIATCTPHFFAKCWIYLKKADIKGQTNKWWA